MKIIQNKRMHGYGDFVVHSNTMEGSKLSYLLITRVDLKKVHTGKNNNKENSEITELHEIKYQDM